MKSLRTRALLYWLPPALLAVSLLVAYLSTLAPDLSWANGGSDGGDLIAAAVTGGVAHPTGYPLYMLLAQLFQLLPVGSLAFRTNLMSAVFAVLAAVVVYETVLHAHSSPETGWPAALASSFGFGLAPLFWSQALITEVYTLQAFLIALILYLYTRPDEGSRAARKRLDRWRGLLLGLAMGNHVTTLLLIPAALAVGSVYRPVQAESQGDSWRPGSAALRLDRGALLRQFGMFLAGSCIYLLIPLRALADPPVNWGNAVTPARFWWLVSGQLYQSYYLQAGLADAWGRIQPFAALFLRQFGLAGVLLGLTGLIVFGRASRLYALTAWTALVFSGFAILYGSVDSYVYLIPMLASFSIWMGLGLSGLTHPLAQRYRFFGLVAGLIVTGYFAVRALPVAAQVDASSDLRAESFGREVFAAAPQGAMVFARGDEAVFALWYFHFALGQRPDLMVIAEDLLHFDWYLESLSSRYPALQISRPFPWRETLAYDNPALPVCYVHYNGETIIDCDDPQNGK